MVDRQIGDCVWRYGPVERQGIKFAADRGDGVCGTFAAPAGLPVRASMADSNADRHARQRARPDPATPDKRASAGGRTYRAQNPLAATRQAGPGGSTSLAITAICAAMSDCRNCGRSCRPRSRDRRHIIGIEMPIAFAAACLADSGA